MKAKVDEILVSGNQEPWQQIRIQLNSLLCGWSNYFSHGTRKAATGQSTTMSIKAYEAS